MSTTILDATILGCNLGSKLLEITLAPPGSHNDWVGTEWKGWRS